MSFGPYNIFSQALWHLGKQVLPGVSQKGDTPMGRGQLEMAKRKGM